MKRDLILATVLSAAAAVTSAFQAPRNPTCHLQHSRLLVTNSASNKIKATPRSLTKLYANKQNDIFLLSLYGTLLSSTRAKARLAIQAAFKVWPSLISTARTLNLNIKCLEDESWNWMIEKLCALSSITQQGNSADKMLGCDAVFLVRVLLEEQLLDGGRSNGRGGKYGGKYHPGWTSDFDSNGSVVGSRPLTVGELYANWEELREVMEFKYPVVDEETNRKLDPMPRIREVLRESLLEGNLETQLMWQPLAYDVLLEHLNSTTHENAGTSMILLGHEAQLPSILASFSSMGLSFAVDVDVSWDVTYIEEWLQNRQNFNGDTTVAITSSDRAYSNFNRSRGGSSVLLVVPSSQHEESQSDVIERIILDFDSVDESNVFVVHSSLEVLKQCAQFLGEDNKCLLPGSSRTLLHLLLPEWADNIHLPEVDDAETDPMLNIVTETEFLESFTAKIVPAQL